MVLQILWYFSSNYYVRKKHTNDLTPRVVKQTLDLTNLCFVKITNTHCGYFEEFHTLGIAKLFEDGLKNNNNHGLLCNTVSNDDGLNWNMRILEGFDTEPV